MDPSRMICTRTTLLAAALCLWSPSIFALGLGEPQQRSFLAEPLRVELPVSLGDLESGELSVQVLPLQRDSDEMVSELQMDASGLKAQIRKNPDGYVVSIESARAIREPVVEMSVVLRGGGVKVMRDLTLFLEPRGFAEKPPSAVGRGVARTPYLTDEAAPVLPVSESPVPDGMYGPVQAGETLAAIAAKLPGVKQEEVMRATSALMLLNPQALEGGNPEKVRAGSLLRIPSEGEIRSASDQLPSATTPTRPRTGRAASRRAAKSSLARSSAAVAPIRPELGFSTRLKLETQFASYQKLQPPSISATSSPTPQTAEPITSIPNAESTHQSLESLESVVEPTQTAAQTPPIPRVAAISSPAPAVEPEVVEAPAETSLMARVLLFMSIVLAVVLIRQIRQPAVSITVASPHEPPKGQTAPEREARRKVEAVPLKLVRSTTSGSDPRREVQGLTQRLAALRTSLLGEDSEMRKIMVIEVMVEEGKLAEAEVAIAQMEQSSSLNLRLPA